MYVEASASVGAFDAWIAPLSLGVGDGAGSAQAGPAANINDNRETHPQADSRQIARFVGTAASPSIPFKRGCRLAVG